MLIHLALQRRFRRKTSKIICYRFFKQCLRPQSSCVFLSCCDFGIKSVSIRTTKIPPKVIFTKLTWTPIYRDLILPSSYLRLVAPKLRLLSSPLNHDSSFANGIYFKFLALRVDQCHLPRKPLLLFEVTLARKLESS